MDLGVLSGGDCEALTIYLCANEPYFERKWLHSMQEIHHLLLVFSGLASLLLSSVFFFVAFAVLSETNVKVEVVK